MDDIAEPDISSLLAQIDNFGKSLSTGSKRDVETRKKLRLAARDLCRAMEEPGDIVERVCFSFLEEVSIRIAIDLDLFNILMKSGKPQTLDDLAKATGADGVLLARLLRSLGAVGAVGEVGEVGEETYIPTKVARTFVIAPLAAGVEFCFDCLSPGWNNLPAYLKDTNYHNPTDSMKGAFQKAHNTTSHFIPFLATKPDFQRSFQAYMSRFDEGRTKWTDFFPVEEAIGEGARQDQKAIMFVDVGGGMGHEALALKKQYPKLPGRFVNQDLPQIVSDQELDGVESMAHDFFTPQPLNAARIYYLRNVLHDWNDTQCRKILQHIRAAMDPSYSKVLVNQWIVPTQRATSFMTHQDLNMMATVSAMERTEEQTRALLEGAGLRILHVWRPDDMERPIVRIGPNEYSIDDPQSAKVIYRSGNQLTKNLFSAQEISRHTERRKQTAPLYQWFHYYALDAIATIALDKPFGLLRAAGDIAGLMAAVKRYSGYGAIVGVYPELHPFIFRLISLLTPKGAYGLGYLMQFMNAAIAAEGTEKRFSHTEHHFVSMLYAIHAASPQSFTQDDIRFHIVPSIGGGSDTTAITLGAVVYNLIKSPSVMYRLRKELDGKREKRELSWPVKLRETQDCAYLQAMIKETMRLYPSNGLPLPRIIPEGGLTLAGRHFPGGTIVGINAWVANFNQGVFGADAMTFRPERWLDSSPAQLVEMDNYFLTFGKGPRTCLGKNISLLEISKLVPMLVLEFEFAMADGPGAEWTLVNNWFVRQKDFRVQVSRRGKKVLSI